jgi:uncharacterized membrane protein
MQGPMTALAILSSAVIVPAASALDLSDAEALAIVRRHCVSCHAAEPTHPAMKEAPKSVVLETVADLKKNAQAIEAQTVVSTAMPLGNETEMTDAERAALGRWLKAVR